MGKSDNEVTGSLQEYAKSRFISIDIDTVHLGIGEDGMVMETSRKTAAKAFYRRKNYLRELGCYERLRDFCVESVSGFAVPELVDFDDTLWVIEMGIVSPPRLLDFGKAYLDIPPEYPEGVLEEHLENRAKDYSIEDWSMVLSAYYELASYGIYYYDLRPANIQVRLDG